MYDDLVQQLNESRAHCGMCGRQAVTRNSRDQYICEACLYETIPTPPYRMRWEAADAIEALQAREQTFRDGLAALLHERDMLHRAQELEPDAPIWMIGKCACMGPPNDCPCLQRERKIAAAIRAMKGAE